MRPVRHHLGHAEKPPQHPSVAGRFSCSNPNDARSALDYEHDERETRLSDTADDTPATRGREGEAGRLEAGHSVSVGNIRAKRRRWPVQSFAGDSQPTFHLAPPALLGPDGAVWVD